MEREQELENKGRSSGTRTHACRRRKMTDQGRWRCGRERARVSTPKAMETQGSGRAWREENKRRRRQLWRLGFHVFHPLIVQISSTSCGCIFHPSTYCCGPFYWLRLSGGKEPHAPATRVGAGIRNSPPPPQIAYESGYQSQLQKQIQHPALIYIYITMAMKKWNTQLLNITMVLKKLAKK